MAREADTLVPAGPVIVPLVLAAVVEPFAWALALIPGTLGGAWYGRSSLLVAVHSLTVGVAAMAILGASWQLVPVITARAWRPPARGLTIAFLASLPAFLYGFSVPGLVGTLAAAGIVSVLLVRSVLVLWALATAEGRGVTRAWLVAAELSLLTGLFVATALWAGRLGYPSFSDPIAAVGLHVRLLLGGWVGGSIVGYGSVLLPMFVIGREPSARALALAWALWFGAVVSGSVWLGAAAALLVAGVLGATLLTGVRGPLVQPLFGFVGLGLAGVGLVLGRGDVVVACAICLFALPVVRGMTLKIAPYLLWAQIRPDAPVPPLPVLATVQAGVSAVGAGALVAGLDLAQPVVTAVGAAVLLVGALVHAAVLATILARVGLTSLRTGAIPGTESTS